MTRVADEQTGHQRHRGRTGHDSAGQAVTEELARLHLDLAGPATMLCGPGGHAVVPVTLAASATHVLLGGRRIARTRSDETAARPVAVDGVIGLRLPMPTGTETGTEVAAASAAAFCRLRLVWSRRLVDETVEHLRARRAGSERLLDQQLVKAALADAAIGHMEIDAGLFVDGRPVCGLSSKTLALLHWRVTDTDRTLLRLLGAHGYTSAGPGALAHLSEVLADTYLRDSLP